MAGNRDTLDALLESGGIHLQPSASLDQLPASFPTDFDFSKIEGMMLGLAVGDALGNTTEGKLPEHRHASHGEIRDYLFNHHAGREAGVCSDDSQLAFWTLEALLDDGGLDPERLGARFCRGADLRHRLDGPALRLKLQLRNALVRVRSPLGREWSIDADRSCADAAPFATNCRSVGRCSAGRDADAQ